MLTFLIAVVVVLTIAAIIRLLHRHQIRKRRRSADLSAPLAPLELPPAADEPAREDATEHPGPEEVRHWQQAIRMLREEGEYSRALALSRAQHPRIQAFQQSLVTLRAAIRQAQREERDVDALLGELYATAALADLFRADAPRRPDPRRLEPERLAAAAAERLDLCWSRIGYARLRLLTKTDVRQLTLAWGEPEAHGHAEEAAGAAWPALIEELSAPVRNAG